VRHSGQSIAGKVVSTVDGDYYYARLHQGPAYLAGRQCHFPGRSFYAYSLPACLRRILSTGERAT